MNNEEWHEARAHYGIRTHDYKLIYWYCDPLNQPGSREDHLEPEWELFDLKKDPRELMNVYHDPAYAEVVTEMTAKLDAEMARIGDIPVH
jgi:arylsulfatase A-like enzyme